MRPLSRLIPENWPPPTSEALTVFTLGSVALAAVFLDRATEVALPIATGLLGYLQSNRKIEGA